MRGHRQSLGDRLLSWILREGALSNFEGIALVDARFGKHSDGFKETMEQALALIREHDPRRFARVRKYLSLVTNQINRGGTIAEYDEGLRSCLIEFVPMPEVDQRFVAALYAGILVHEATHGVIASWGIQYKGKNRERIERICTAEKNRFLTTLAKSAGMPPGIECLQESFDPENWERQWRMGRGERLRSYVSRCLRDLRRESAASLGEEVEG